MSQFHDELKACLARVRNHYQSDDELKARLASIHSQFDEVRGWYYNALEDHDVPFNDLTPFEKEFANRRRSFEIDGLAWLILIHTFQ